MRPINIAEYEALARERLHPAVWDYYSAGADDEVTLRENRAAFERITLRPRALASVGRPILWGLAVEGAAGAQRTLELLRAELALAMALAGRPTLASIDTTLVRQPG